LRNKTLLERKPMITIPFLQNFSMKRLGNLGRLFLALIATVIVWGVLQGVGAIQSDAAAAGQTTLGKIFACVLIFIGLVVIFWQSYHAQKSNILPWETWHHSVVTSITMVVFGNALIYLNMYLLWVIIFGDFATWLSVNLVLMAIVVVWTRVMMSRKDQASKDAPSRAMLWVMGIMVVLSLIFRVFAATSPAVNTPSLGGLLARQSDQRDERGKLPERFEKLVLAPAKGENNAWSDWVEVEQGYNISPISTTGEKYWMNYNEEGGKIQMFDPGTNSCYGADEKTKETCFPGPTWKVRYRSATEKPLKLVIKFFPYQ
jgi:hypothetical protein